MRAIEDQIYCPLNCGSVKGEYCMAQNLTFQQAEAIRQTQATLALEGMFLNKTDIRKLRQLATGAITRQEYQDHLKEQYMSYEC